MKRNNRQNAIREIIQEQEIGTQGELKEALKAKGFNTTQATQENINMHLKHPKP